jgi:hypothetical protein
MNAWQEAQHDLIYKQMSGTPSDDEKYLIEMINGLAHTGEIALNQLQTLSNRRLQDRQREFSDEYELATWLKKNSLALLERKEYEPGEDAAWDEYQPYMEQITFLFGILRMFHRNSPKELLRTLDPSESRMRGLQYLDDEKTLKELLEIRIGKPITLTSWEELFRNDATYWAIFQICADRFKDIPQFEALKESGTSQNSLANEDSRRLAKARLRAFIIVSTLNFASSVISRATFLETFMDHVLSRCQNKDIVEWALARILMSSNWKDDPHENYLDAVDDAWASFLICLKEWGTSFLLVGCALSCASIIVVPQPFHSRLWQYSGEDAIIWPGYLMIENETAKLWRAPGNLRSDLVVSTVVTNETSSRLVVGEFEWMVGLVSLRKIVSGGRLVIDEAKRQRATYRDWKCVLIVFSLCWIGYV